ncbi:MAG: hypothetical protein IID18_04940 [Nitrospinae bacterium]|nr:hypothetical protein [Nitrospinota bacterium]
MIKVECYSGYQINERPVAFQLCGRRYKVKEVVDRWYGEGAIYFKVEADDNNIYLLKYEEGQDTWDLVFYQNPRKVEAMFENFGGDSPAQRFGFKTSRGNMQRMPRLH